MNNDDLGRYFCLDKIMVELQDYIILSLGAAVNFSMLTVVLFLLDLPYGLKKGISYLVGSEIVLLIIGVVFLIRPDLLMHLRVHRSFEDFNVAIGSILIILGLINYFRSKEEKPAEEMRADGWIKYFAWGFTMMGTNFNTLAMYLVVIKNIILITPGEGKRLILLAVSNAIINLMVWLPLVFYKYYPALIDKILKPLGNFIHKYSRGIITTVLIAVGLYLLLRGIFIK